MPPGSSSAGGFRESIKRRARRVKKWFEPEDQASASRTPSPLPQPQLQPLPSALPPQMAPTHETHLHPPAQTQQSQLLPQPVPNAGVSTSTANIVMADNAQPADAESRLTQVAKKTGADAWASLKTTLQLVEKGAGVFPPLKEAVAGFRGVVDIFETAAQNRNDYEALALHLESVVAEFRKHPEERTSSGMSEALKAMSSDLDKELKHVLEQRQRTGFRSHLEAEQDLSDVQQCHRRVDTLCRELQNKAVLKTWSIVEEQQARARLKDLNAALQAMYDSSLADVVGRRTCTSGTREAILAEMRNWANDPEGPKVYWLNGMAGTGKTTLAYSFCAEMKLAGRLGASFFCSRTDPGSKDVSRIVPTIAYQLADLLPSYREVLVRQIGNDKDIGMRQTQIQFEKLIRGPLREVQGSMPEGIVVTIDALDECDRREGAQDVLNALLLHAQDLPIRFFITCRPEPGLFDVLQLESGQRRTALALHDVEASFVHADIRTYLEAELNATSLSQEKLRQLAEQAGTLFIYAATAVRYIHPKGRRVNFHQRLNDLLAVASKGGSEKHRRIDTLYSTVLAVPFADVDLGAKDKENIRLILDTSICVKEPMSVTAMAHLLELEEEDVICALQYLRSVLHVSPGANLVSTLHASFPDFMLDRERSQDLRCNAAKHHHHLSLCCFSTMHRLLRFNICDLASSFDLDESVPGLAEKVKKAISPELFYACRYWLDHLVSAEAPNDIQSVLEGFLSCRLLFWMEVLNLNRCINIGARGLYRILAWSQRNKCPVDIQQLIRDAAGFVTMFSSNAASRSTPHIYVSALPFWPEQRPISQHYSQKTKGLPKATGTGIRRQEAAPLATWVTPNAVSSVAHSSDGARIVSGSWDNMVHIWDAHTGKTIGGPLEGHTSRVYSVAFSSDDARIVSGSDDNTIRIWDAQTGKMIGEPLQGHTGAVRSVAFSSDDARIVSGSSDNTIRIWDAQTGKMIGDPLQGHTSAVNSVAFSSDDARIVSGSDDHTIRIWDAQTGKMIGDPLEGHTSAVNSVAFSSDDARIVSGSYDYTIRIWDAHTGKMIGDPLQGHTNPVMSVGFSSDDARIVSGSHDKTIRIWDAQTGKMIGDPLQGHTSPVNSVGFSSDDARIVSGSYDNTIRIWDAQTGKMIGDPLQGHTSAVYSVAFSSDDARIVSGSDDTTIRIWDAQTGKIIGDPLQGHTGAVVSVAFSSDDARIVSGSWDNTIRIWDAQTGKMIGDPLEGHTRAVNSVAFSSGDARVVSGSWDKTIRIWDAQTGKMIGEPLQGHTGAVNSVAFSSDDARIVSGSDDNTIRIWDAQTGKMIGDPLEGHTSGVISVAFSSDDACIVSGSWDNMIRIWDVHTGKMIGDPLQGHTSRVWSVAFSSDDARIVSGSDDNTIRIWDAHTGTMIGDPLQGHTDAVNSIALSSDDTRVVSGSLDTTIRTVNLEFVPSDLCSTWVLDQDGFMLATGSKYLMWVPHDVRTALMHPQSIAIISTQGSVTVDFTNAYVGDSWTRCYECTKN